MACWNGRPMGKMCFMSWRPKQNRSPAMFSSRFSRPPSLTIHLNVCWFISGWWLTYPSEKKKKSSVGIIIPNTWKNKIHVPNHQPNIPKYVETTKDLIHSHPVYDWTLQVAMTCGNSKIVGIYIYYPLVMTNSLLLKMAIEIVIFTMTNGDFSIVMLVYQRVDCIVSCLF